MTSEESLFGGNNQTMDPIVSHMTIIFTPILKEFKGLGQL